jgi:hypothetical protein
MNQNHIYWDYETSIGHNLNFSVRSTGLCKVVDYYKFLSKFITNHADRIYDLNPPDILADGSYVCIIRMHGDTEINFPNYRAY